MNSPGHTPTDIQSHLYLSFLRGHTADVALHTKGGTWEAVYQLHRVVLIQAGFFRSLFTTGFLESQPHDSHAFFGSPPDKVDIRFDDLNITRSAFEVCIARLYGGGPELYLSPSLIPTPTCPLTPSFYSVSSTPQIPLGHHPATPRFLLSLLATSVYLSIPSITSQALSLVLGSVGPHTVVRYLNFATGLGIGPSEGNDPEAAVGLEDVAKEVISKEDPRLSMTDNTKHEDSSESGISGKLSILDSVEGGGKADGSSVKGACQDEAAFNYGGIGDKVGETCACWLMRWSADILPYEDAKYQEAVTSGTSAFLRSEAGHSHKRAAVPSGWSSPSSTVTAPKLWARGGLSASWACAVISSNDFFIGDEWERYEFALRVVDLRRRDGQDPDEEEEWTQLFERGIHYSNMTFEELIRISQDTSPATGRPYVPIETIQSAHWMQSLLRHRIVTRSPVAAASTSPSTRQGDKELGITLSTADILATISSDSASDAERSKPYYPIPVDTSERLGDSDNAFASAAASADQLLGSPSDQPGHSHSTPRQGNFFGILPPHYTAASCIQADATGKTHWSPYPPYRFAIEFWGVGQLMEKSRLHSRTIWYAGSLFNVFVQVVRKKGVQLGVYLRRQSSVDPIPRASAPPVLVSTRAERLLNSSPVPSTPRASTANTSQPEQSQSSPVRGHRSSTSVASVAFAVPGSPSPPTPSHFQPSTMSLAAPGAVSVPTAPMQPYRDPRPSISAHFVISCASATGSSLTRFLSSPDQFSIGQSWGWKSSSLLTEEYTQRNGEPTAGEPNREASLRATVVLGLN